METLREVAEHKLNIKVGIDTGETVPSPLQRREVQGDWRGDVEAP
jgi:hypothetical protein